MADRNDKSLDTSITPPELVEFRRQIDAMDAEIIDLLKRRCEVVAQVGEYKRSKGFEGCFIRPGREADMLRYIWKEFEGSRFSPVAACAIWRLIIAASTSIESDLRISVYATDTDQTLYWLAREYFGEFITIIRHPNCNRVVGDVVDGKAEVGILPPLSHENHANWWLTLAQQEENPPKLFAHIPFVVNESESARYASFAIARIDAEPTENDITLLAVETLDISIHKLNTAFATVGMKASRIAFTNNVAHNSVHHLLQIPEYIAADDPRLSTVLERLGDAVISHKVLGTYAPPIVTDQTC
jgi:chorismate mutase / prephenate dehydratase